MEFSVFGSHSWPRAIIHIDGDAFFTSCEEAIHPELRGRPLITGAERGIVACASYAAKARGVTRGLPVFTARRICPELVVLPSDYETYSLFSRRLFSVMRRFTPQVEEYSIDEAFADITGLRRLFRGSYESIAATMKRTVSAELGLTVSLGLSTTKVLAKIASKHNKPDGMTIIRGREIGAYLKDLPLEKVWGIGHATAQRLGKLGVHTALDLARLPGEMVRKRFEKPLRELWRELRGDPVHPVITEEKSRYASISKTKTFSPSRDDRDYVAAQLFRNFESACIKARRHSLAARRVDLFLKTQDFRVRGAEIRLSRPSARPMECARLISDGLGMLYERGTLYRATGVVLLDLVPDEALQYELFEDSLKVERVERVYEAADYLARKYGKHILHLGGSHLVERQGTGKRGEPTARARTRFRGESGRKHLGLPVLHVSTKDREVI